MKLLRDVTIYSGIGKAGEFISYINLVVAKNVESKRENAYEISWAGLDRKSHLFVIGSRRDSMLQGYSAIERMLSVFVREAKALQYRRAYEAPRMRYFYELVHPNRDSSRQSE